MREKRLAYVVSLGIVFFCLISVSLELKNRSLKEKYGEKVSNLNKVIDQHKSRIRGLNFTISRLESEVTSLKENLSSKAEKIGDLQTRVEELNNTKARLQKKNTRLMSRINESSSFHTPTPEEVRRVVHESDIDEKEWSRAYDCTEFSYDLVEEFKENNIDACTVELRFKSGKGHILVTVNTTEGICYIEPQNDVVFKEIKVENDYCDIVGWDCDWNIIKVSSCYTLKYSNG